MRVRYIYSSRRTRGIDPFNAHKKAVPDVVKDLIRISDIVLEILDARFIDETRIKEMEDIVKEWNKKLIYVLNKSDMVDKKELMRNPKLKELYPYVVVSAKDRTGIKMLRNRIKIEAKRALKEKKFEKAHVGIFGYPNTGKSSLINLLSGKSSAKVSSVAGYTKGMQKIRLSKGIFLLDTPGVMPRSEDTQTDREAAKKHAEIGAQNYDRVKDPEFVVFSLMKENPGLLEKFYEIDAKGDAEILIEKLGRKRNLLLKGNVPDSYRTSMLIIKEWQEGKIHKITSGKKEEKDK